MGLRSVPAAHAERPDVKLAQKFFGKTNKIAKKNYNPSLWSGNPLTTGRLIQSPPSSQQRLSLVFIIFASSLASFEASGRLAACHSEWSRFSPLSGKTEDD